MYLWSGSSPRVTPCCPSRLGGCEMKNGDARYLLILHGYRTIEFATVPVGRDPSRCTHRAEVRAVLHAYCDAGTYLFEARSHCIEKR